MKFGKIEFSNGQKIPFRMPFPMSEFDGLDILWGDKKVVTWMKISFDQVKPESAPASLSEIAVFK